MSNPQANPFQHGKDDAMLKQAAKKVDVDWKVHRNDHIFNFLINHPGFPDEQTKIDYYFNDAQKSARQLADILAKHGNGSNKKTRLLEFASGYGCVSRHLKNSSEIDLTSCDIHEEGVKFLSETLGVKSILSNSQPEFLKTADDFDAVFALSFFSHMPITTWTRWLLRLIRTIHVDGLVIFTTQGNHSLPFLGNPEVNELGFHFQQTSEQKDLPLEEYGNTIATPEFVQKTVSTIPQVALLELLEGYWWDHQDLYILRKKEEI